jgi:hypothetical protein
MGSWISSNGLWWNVVAILADLTLIPAFSLEPFRVL